MQVTISEKQLGAFFAVLGIGVIVTSSLVIEENRNGAARLLGCIVTGLIAGLAQMVMSLLLFFKDEYKKHWVYAHALLFILYIIVFSIPLSDGYNKRCGSNMDAYFAVVGVDFILTFGGLVLMRGALK